MRVCLVMFSALALAACGRSSPEFFIDLGSNRLAVARGATGALTVTLQADDGFEDEVTVRAAVTPETAPPSGPLSFGEQTVSGRRTVAFDVPIDPTIRAGTEFDVEVVAVSARHRATAMMRVVVNEAGGAPDPSFADGKPARSPQIGWRDETCAMAPATAQLTVYAAVEGGQYVLRAFDVAGKPAATFGTAGVVRTGVMRTGVVREGGEPLCSLLRDVDGGLLLVGERAGNPSSLFIARYTNSGALDTTYGTAGIAALPSGAQDDTLGSAVALPGGGAVVLATMLTRIYDVPTSVLVLMRVDPQGTPILDFGVNGRAEHPDSQGNSYSKIAVTPDMRLLVARTVSVDPTHRNLVLERFLPMGNRDETFAGGAMRAVVPYSADVLVPVELLVQPDGNVLVASGTGGGGPFDLRRFSSEGAVDTTFGTDGLVHFMPDATISYPSAAIGGLTLDASRRIVAALDYRVHDDPGELRLVRLQPDGSFDTSFGSDGQYTVFVPADRIGRIVGVSVLSDGRIVTVGQLSMLENVHFATRTMP